MAGRSRHSDGASLADFLADGAPLHNGTCWLCGIPERGEVDEALARGVRARAIVGYLSTRGYRARARTQDGRWVGDLSSARINYHYQMQHHLRGGGRGAKKEANTQRISR